MYEKTVEQSVMAATAIVAMVTINRLNPVISDFFQSPFMVFLIITLYLYNHNKNILTSMATAFFFTVFVGIVTMPEPLEKAREAFELIYPGTNSHAGCANITIKELLNAFENDEAKLKNAMDESSVPYNLSLTDENAPEIATYLINNSRIKQISESCKL